MQVRQSSARPTSADAPAPSSARTTPKLPVNAATKKSGVLPSVERDARVGSSPQQRLHDRAVGVLAGEVQSGDAAIEAAFIRRAPPASSRHAPSTQPPAPRTSARSSHPPRASARGRCLRRATVELVDVAGVCGDQQPVIGCGAIHLAFPAAPTTSRSRDARDAPPAGPSSTLASKSNAHASSDAPGPTPAPRQRSRAKRCCSTVKSLRCVT
jgi:hypothetical protein